MRDRSHRSRPFPIRPVGLPHDITTRICTRGVATKAGPTHQLAIAMIARVARGKTPGRSPLPRLLAELIAFADFFAELPKHDDLEVRSRRRPSTRCSPSSRSPGSAPQFDASLNYSMRPFLPSTFSLVSARLRSRNFVNQSVAPAFDAGGRLLR